MLVCQRLGIYHRLSLLLTDLSTLGNKVQLEFSYLIYSDVVQNQGQYDWTVVDDLLAAAASRGRQVNDDGEVNFQDIGPFIVLLTA